MLPQGRLPRRPERQRAVHTRGHGRSAISLPRAESEIKPPALSVVGSQVRVTPSWGYYLGAAR